MAKPVVAIVGRPNVGKSTLFNKLIGTRLSIVDDTPGVTRDRIYGDCEWLNHKFLLVDTGGIEPNTSDVILSQMRTQAEIAISTADVIILVTNIRDGVVASDYDVATMLQKSGKPIILCVNHPFRGHVQQKLPQDHLNQDYKIRKIQGQVHLCRHIYLRIK